MPEPVVERVDEAPAESAELTDSMSIAYLVLLEQLSATERAVFLLHDVFGYRFDEIAPIVDRSEAGCRQIAVRARRRLDPDRPRFERDVRRRSQVAALPEPIDGRDRVVHLLRAFANQNKRLKLRFEPTRINGQPGAVVRDLDGLVVTVLALDIASGVVQTVRSIVNPDKIGHLGAVSPLTRRVSRSGA
jgi:RNA polymerase sigma-70 factor, ECF subfamily